MNNQISTCSLWTYLISLTAVQIGDVLLKNDGFSVFKPCERLSYSEFPACNSHDLQYVYISAEQVFLFCLSIPLAGVFNIILYPSDSYRECSSDEPNKQKQK
jgi:hypothetical protein